MGLVGIGLAGRQFNCSQQGSATLQTGPDIGLERKLGEATFGVNFGVVACILDEERLAIFGDPTGIPFAQSIGVITRLRRCRFR